MLRWLINRRIDKTERELGASLDYLRHIQRTAPRAFFKFLKLLRKIIRVERTPQCMGRRPIAAGSTS